MSVNVNSWQEVKGNPGMGATNSAFKVDTVTPAVAVSINNSDFNLAYDTAIISSRNVSGRNCWAMKVRNASSRESDPSSSELNPVRSVSLSNAVLSTSR